MEKGKVGVGAHTSKTLSFDCAAAATAQRTKGSRQAMAVSRTQECPDPRLQHYIAIQLGLSRSERRRLFFLPRIVHVNSSGKLVGLTLAVPVGVGASHMRQPRAA